MQSQSRGAPSDAPRRPANARLSERGSRISTGWNGRHYCSAAGHRNVLKNIDLGDRGSMCAVMHILNSLRNSPINVGSRSAKRGQARPKLVRGAAAHGREKKSREHRRLRIYYNNNVTAHVVNVRGEGPARWMEEIRGVMRAPSRRWREKEQENKG